MAQLADFTGEVATHRHTSRRAVMFCRARLILSPEAGWSGGRCLLLRAAGHSTEIACDVLSAVSAGEHLFPVEVTGADVPVLAHGIVARFPQGADCYLFRRMADGMWDGVAITAAYRRIAIVAYACDPA